MPRVIIYVCDIRSTFFSFRYQLHSQETSPTRIYVVLSQAKREVPTCRQTTATRQKPREASSHNTSHNSKQQGTTNHKIKTYCIVPYCSTSNPVTNRKIKINKRHASQAQLADPSRKPGRKTDKEHQSRWYPRKQKKRRENEKVGHSTGNAARKGGKQDKISWRRNPTSCLPGWLALCHAKRKKGYAELVQQKENRNRKWVFSPNRRLLKLCPCPHVD